MGTVEWKLRDCARAFACAVRRDGFVVPENGFEALWAEHANERGWVVRCNVNGRQGYCLPSTLKARS